MLYRFVTIKVMRAKNFSSFHLAMCKWSQYDKRYLQTNIAILMDLVALYFCVSKHLRRDLNQTVLYSYYACISWQKHILAKGNIFYQLNVLLKIQVFVQCCLELLK